MDGAEMDKRRHDCSLCDAKFNKVHHLRRHFRTVHCSDERSYFCDICHKSFGREDTMKMHRTNHFRSTSKMETSQLRCQCDICGQTLSKPSHLTRHKRSKHRGHNSHRPDHHCEVCLKSFSRSDALKRHQAVHMTDRQEKQKGKCLFFVYLYFILFKNLFFHNVLKGINHYVISKLKHFSRSVNLV